MHESECPSRCHPSAADDVLAAMHPAQWVASCNIKTCLSVHEWGLVNGSLNLFICNWGEPEWDCIAMQHTLMMHVYLCLHPYVLIP